MSHHELEWMCAACGWVHYPVQKPVPVRGHVNVCPSECENCGHRATLGSWLRVKWLEWYSEWEVIGG